ncbi:hypothetical protein [uncultured Variovorax sp.]|uniref:hypothetical protein n=1 Tax=uncultured Variovorax sp. TaxID=114708 RepID=UPI002615F3DF|nr:hypothetical protein [uncultured Variovorax sp.]
MTIAIRRLSVLIALSAALPLVASVASARTAQADSPAVAAFYAHPDHCVGMVSVIEDQTPEQTSSFEAARTRAVTELLRARPKTSDLEALLTLKSGCDRTLAEKARAGGVKNAANTAVPRAK